MNREEYEGLRTKIEAEYQQAILAARRERDEGLKAIAIVRRMSREEEEGADRGPPPRQGRPPKARDPDGKDCAGCGKRKPYSEFHLNPGASDGRNAHCKDCRKEKPPPKPPEEAQTDGPGERLCAKGEDCVAFEPPFGPPALSADRGQLCEGCKERAGLG